MSGKIFVLQNVRGIVTVTEQAYESEADLQELIEGHPAGVTEQAYDSEKELQELIEKHLDLLSGDQIDSAAPRKLLLIKSEMNSGKYSLDDLFLDQDGVPTLVEVKRSKDTRIRREVIGQMLDYAANGVAYWPVTTLQTNFAATWKGKADQKLAEFLDAEADAENADEAYTTTNSTFETFWQKVSANLEAGRLRLLFVADEFLDDTLRVIDFLNKSMRDTRALAIEIRQFVTQTGTDPQIKLLVSRVRHVETKSTQENDGGEDKRWDEESFFKNMERRHNAEGIVVARSILKWVQDESIPFRWTKFTTTTAFGSFNPFVTLKNVEIGMFAVKSSGTIEFYVDALSSRPGFEDISRRNELFTRLSALTGKSIAELQTGTYHSAKLSKLGEEANLTQLLSSLKWVVKELQKANA